MGAGHCGSVEVGKQDRGLSYLLSGTQLVSEKSGDPWGLPPLTELPRAVCALLGGVNTAKMSRFCVSQPVSTQPDCCVLNSAG